MNTYSSILLWLSFYIQWCRAARLSFFPHFQHRCLLQKKISVVNTYFIPQYFCGCLLYFLYLVIQSGKGVFFFSSSNTGVVNIYDKDTCMASQSPKPEKAIMNLTTSCTGAVFNSCTEILALASNLNEKSIKLVRTAGQLNRGCHLLGSFNAMFSLERYWWGPRSQEVEGWVGYT